MRGSLLLSALCAASAMATPVAKRAYVTDLTVVTVTEYVTRGAAPTPAPQQPPKDEAGYQPPVVVTKTKHKHPTKAPVKTYAPKPQPTYAPAPEPKPKPQPTYAPPPANNYQSLVLKHHNIHRSNHSAPALTWSDELAKAAQVLAQRCVFDHDTSIGGGDYGQNIGYGFAPDSVGKLLTNMMYNDEAELFSSFYGMADPDMSQFKSWGHFTQMVWKDTKTVGCATYNCNNDINHFTVCNYGPPGNYPGEYAKNVLKPQGASMAVA
ncbi:hypothetical protein FQN50_003402 [Emmonsiellopsis sp. PD_5]|nr:hypothetical protein FQN50_003402 [Emmonsiellopsis sp. PD_5]